MLTLRYKVTKVKCFTIKTHLTPQKETPVLLNFINGGTCLQFMNVLCENAFESQAEIPALLIFFSV